MRSLNRWTRVMVAFFTLCGGYVAGSAWAQGAKPLTRCAPDAVVAGTVCMDRYEASVWRVPNATTTNKALVKKIQQGRATAVSLAAGGATQLGVASDDYTPCADNGQNCADDIYAASLPGVVPSAYITWFQALAACENARKRLPTNSEWQVAVTGTPATAPMSDNGTTDCRKLSGFSAVSTGSRTSCVSQSGAFDMVGNLWEWVADWTVRSTTCGSWTAGVSPFPTAQCLAGAATTGEPGAVLRGGSFSSVLYGFNANPLAISADSPPSAWGDQAGFRCAR
jgi:hypothetical protein